MRACVRVCGVSNAVLCILRTVIIRTCTSEHTRNTPETHKPCLLHSETLGSNTLQEITIVLQVYHVTHACTYLHTRMYTCTHAKQSLRQPYETQLLSPSEPVLGYLPCAGRSSWGRASNPQEDYPGLMERGHGIQSSTTTSTPLSETRTVGHLLPQLIPGTH